MQLADSKNARIAEFAKKSPSFNILSHDFFADERRRGSSGAVLQKDNADSAHDVPGELREPLMVYQRLARIKQGMDIGLIEGLVELGLHSASRIASLSAVNFISQALPLFKNDEHAARDFHKRADHIKMKATHLLAGIRDLAASPAYRGLKCNVAQSDSGLDFFKQLPSYTSLFGNMDYLETDPGQTIFSPSSYFFDMMRIVDEYITAANPNIPEGYRLQDRRPDLFSLKLTPNNSFTEIPYLQIANGILTEQVGILSGGTDAFQTLALASYPFNLPFIRPLAEFRASMEKLGVPLSRLYTVMAVEPEAAVRNPGAVRMEDALREAAGLSVSDRDRLIRSDASEAAVARTYGYDVSLNKIIEVLPAAGTGTVDLFKAAKEISGENTKFTSELLPGDQIKIDGHVRTVMTVQSNILATLDAPAELAAVSRPFTILHKEGLDLVDTFLERTALTRDALEELLVQGMSAEEFAAGAAGSFFINATGESVPTVAIAISDDPANPTQRLTGLTLPRLDRMSRFICLSRLCGLSFPELQWLMEACGAREIKEELIVAIGRVKTLQESQGWTLLGITAWSHGLKTSGKGSGATPSDQFNLIFNAPNLLRGDPHAPGSELPFNPFLDPPQSWSISGTDDTALQIRTRLRAALGIGDQYLTMLAEFVLCLMGSADQKTLPLTLDTFSWLYRLVWLSRVTARSVQENLVFLSLLYFPETGEYLKPPKDAIPLGLEELDQLAKMFRWAKETGFNIWELKYIVTGDGKPGYQPDYAQESIGTFINELAAASVPARLTPRDFTALALDADQSAALMEGLVGRKQVDAAGIFLTNEVSYVLVADLLPVRMDADSYVLGFDEFSFASDDAYAILEKDSQKIFATLKDKGLLTVGLFGSETAGVAQSFDAETDLDFLRTLFDGADDSGRKTEYVRSTLLTARSGIDTLLSLLSEKSSKQRESVIRGVAAHLKTNPDTISALLDFTVSAAEVKHFLRAFILPDMSDAVKKCIAVLSKWCMVAEKFRLNAAEVAYIVSPDGEAHILGAGKALTQPSLSALYNISEYARLRDEADAPSELLLAYFQSTAAEKASALAAATGWKLSDIIAFKTYFGAGSSPEDTIHGLVGLFAAFDTCRALGVHATTLLTLVSTGGMALEAQDHNLEYKIDSIAWAAYEKVVEIAHGIVSARFSEDALNTVQTALQKNTHDACRNALLGYVLWRINAQRSEIKTVNDLYAYLLLDVKMGPCFMTSHIAQGIASVQLYLQRCRMMLEPGVTNLEIPKVWWQWIMNYRVWEANRRIFLYPENYLEPSLRKDATPEFKTLGDDLSQNDLSKTTVIPPFQKYITQAAKLGDLCPVGSFQVRVPDATSGTQVPVLYLVGRTRHEPYEFYLRTLTDENNWGNWEKIDVPISASWVSAAYYFDKLFLFWSEIEENESSSLKEGTSSCRKICTASIKYAYTINKSWSQIQTLKKNIIINTYPSVYKESSADCIFNKDSSFWRYPKILVVGNDFSGKEQAIISSRKGNMPLSVAANSNSCSSASTRTQIYADINIGEYIQLENEIRLVTNIYRHYPDRTSKDYNYYSIITVDRPFNNNHNNVDYYILPSDKIGNGMHVYLGPIISYSISVKTDLSLADHINDNFVNSQIFMSEDIEKCNTAHENNKNQTAFVDILCISNGMSHHQYVMTIDKDPTAQAGYDNKPYSMQLFRSGLSSSLRLHNVHTPLKSHLLSTNIKGFQNPENVQPVSPLDILHHVAGEAASLIGVGNAPSSFLFDNYDEAFLIRPNQFTEYKLLSDGIRFSIPYLESGSELRQLHVTTNSFSSLPTLWNATKFTFKRTTSAILPELYNKMALSNIDSLLSLKSQFLKEKRFERFLDKKNDANILAPLEDMDFSGSCGIYFWEIFFHSACLIAERLQAGKKFEDALGWLEYIFNPTQGADEYDTADSPTRFWRFVPFREMALSSLLANLNNSQQISRYNNDPFDPHAIAAIRHSAYAKSIVMRYVGILLDHGDQLFSQYTQESIAQATNLYIHAENLLGKRPTSRGKMPLPDPKSYAGIKADHQGQALPQFLIDLENVINWLPDHDEQRYASQPINDINAYFAVPENADFMALWDRLEDRLYKIRHCMTIDGKYIPLALYAPPIDPKLLASLPPESISEVISGISGGAVPFYHFSHLVAKAQSLCGHLSSLSQSVLSAMEKKDAESLSQLTNREESAVLALQTSVREQEVEDTAAQLEALQQNLAGAESRQTHYSNLLLKGISDKEQASLEDMLRALTLSTSSNITRMAASVAFALPQVGSPFAMTYGGVIIPFLVALQSRAYAACISFMAGVIPPMPMFGRSLL